MTGYFDVVTYGADPTGATDSTAAINAAIAAAKVACPTGAVLGFEPGNYSVDSINGTSFNSVRYVALGGPSSVTITGNRQTTPAPVLDCTGSSAVIIDGIIFGGGASVTNPPLAGILLAATSANNDSNANRIDNCGSIGYFGSAGLCIIGSPGNQVYSSRFQQDYGGRPTLIVSTSPDWYIASKYQTITSGAANVGKNVFFGSEFHGRKALSQGDATCWTIYGRNIDSMSFHGSLIDSSGQGHVLLQGSGNNSLAFFGSGFYTESGYSAQHLMEVDSALVKFITHGCTEVGAYTGARLTGVAPGVVSNI